MPFACRDRWWRSFHRTKGDAVEILYLLIPLSIVLVLAVMVLFWWALQAGQFDNIEREGERILRDD